MYEKGHRASQMLQLNQVVKPEETKLISDSAGLFEPEVVAR